MGAHTEEHCAKISAGVRRAMAEGRGPGKSSWRPPAEFRQLYQQVYNQVGAIEARRIIEEHIAVVMRRRAKS